MRNVLRNTLAIILLLATPMFGGCVATEQDVVSLDLRLRSVDNRLDKLETSLAAVKKTQEGTVEQLRRKQAETGSTTEELQSLLLQTQGQLEEERHRRQQLAKELRQGQRNLASRLAGMEKRLAALDAKLADFARLLTETRETAQATAADLAAYKELQAKKAAEEALAAARRAEEIRRRERQVRRQRQLVPAKKKRKPGAEVVAAPAPAAPSPAPTPAGKKTAATAQAQADKAAYDAAYALFSQRKYKEAYSALQKFVATYPKSPLVPNAIFWSGDCLYNQKEYEMAILEYQKVVADYPKNPKAPAALLKQALAFEKLGDSQTAEIIYQKIVSEYPKSDQAKTARQRLKQ